jgi:hypothetical protein
MKNLIQEIFYGYHLDDVELLEMYSEIQVVLVLVTLLMEFVLVDLNETEKNE